jgi:L-ribulose-5-phosphate 3-epimerase UlaE
MNILLKANEIVFERNEEKERMYGPFQEGMQEAAKIASLLSRKEITTVDMYNCMLALKLSRASYYYKEDNYLDLVAYIASLNDYQNNVQNEHSKDKKRKNTK